MDTQVAFSVMCDEPEGKIVRYVRPLIFTEENIIKFWECAKAFPSLYGKQILSDPESFANIFMRMNNNGEYELNGLLWVIDDFVGVFYLSDIEYDRDIPINANVHYTFFDRRHRGRKNLCKTMVEYVFNRYKFRRLSIEIPNYSKDATRHFALDIGFHYEGKRRKAAKYKDDWFDVNLYGVLSEEALNGRT